MQCSKPSRILDHPTPNLYLTAIAELDDIGLFEMVAGAGVILAQYSKDMEEIPENAGLRRKALLDATRTAHTLYTAYQERMGDGRWFSRLPTVQFSLAGHREEPGNSMVRAQEEILPFKAQSDSPVPGDPP